MKRVIKVVATISLMGLLLSGCGVGSAHEPQSPRYDYYAIFTLPNGEVIEGDAKYISGREYLQIEVDGVTYRVSSLNCVLITK